MAIEGTVADKPADAGAAAAAGAAGAVKTDAAAGADAGAAGAAKDGAAAAGGEKKPDAAVAAAGAAKDGAAADAGSAKKDDVKKTSILGAAASKDGAVKTDDKTDASKGAPEKYADFKLPEGVALDKGLLEKVVPLFKKHGFSQATAQEFVDFQAQNLKAEIDGRLNAVAMQSEAWAKESREQFGATWEKEFANAAKGIESFGTPKTREILTAVGLDNHPEFVAMFARIGAKLGEGQPVDGKPAGSERVPTEKLMFDKMGPKT